MKIKPCRLVGGPYRGWSGEFVDKGQEVALFGPPGGKSFAYRRQETQRGKAVVFRYDTGMTADLLREAGLDQEMVDEAVRLDRPPTRRGRAGIKVEVVPLDDRWSMRAHGVEVATLPREEIPDRDTARKWVESVFLPHKKDEDNALAC